MPIAECDCWHLWHSFSARLDLRSFHRISIGLSCRLEWIGKRIRNHRAIVRVLHTARFIDVGYLKRVVYARTRADPDATTKKRRDSMWLSAMHVGPDCELRASDHLINLRTALFDQGRVLGHQVFK